MNLARNILTTLSARIAVMGLALISSVVLARILGPEARGLFALMLLLPEVGRLLGLCGFEQANAVYAGLEPTKRSALLWHSTAFALLVGGLLAAVGISFVAIGAPGFEALVRGPVWLYYLALATIPARLLFDY